MRFVILLGALTLVALATTAENQDKAIDKLGEDILIRDAREAKKKTRRGKKRTSRKKKAARRNKNKNGSRRGDRKRNKKDVKKVKKGKRRNRNRKGGKSASQKNNRQTDGCLAFYTPASIRDFRYARNQIQKAKRIKNSIAKLEKLTAKAAEAFLAGAAFYKDCSAPEAPGVYEGLSQCNVTAANDCNPAALLVNYTNELEDLDLCIENLTNTLNSSEDCLKGYCLDTCNYIPIGLANDPPTCDYRQFDRAVAKQINSKCSNSTLEGSFTSCNNLLKDSYPIANNCSSSPTMTTVAPYSGRLRKSLNIWKV